MKNFAAGYLLPFLALALLVAALSLKVRWWGGPGVIVTVFFAVLLGPSLLYALIADESSYGLFGGSLAAALAVAGFMLLRYRKKMTADYDKEDHS